MTEAPAAPHHVTVATAMCNALAHRGPDGQGQFTASNITLAMRRLSIVDLEGGWQPLYNEDRTLALVANGEIYNFIELRAQLTRLGHRFATKSDCEVIVHLYEEYGADCVHHLRGMFAFALWDGRRRCLLLARDRMGEKPLYLFQSDGMLLFASELKALLRSGLVPFALDPTAVNLYFHYQYVPEPYTPLQGVRKLDAAHVLLVHVDEWRIEERCYWRMEDSPPIETDPIQALREELERVTNLVLRADVPVGVALSSGLDSSLIAALAAKQYKGTLHAFSVGYAQTSGTDERAEAHAFAQHLGIPFHDVEIDNSEVVTAFPDLIAWQDDPIADISGFGYYALMRAARAAGVPVLLQGQGGDELFWGYKWVQEAAQKSEQRQRAGHNVWRTLPQHLVDPILRALTAHSMHTALGAVMKTPARWRSFQQARAAPRAQLVFYDLAPDFSTAAERMPTLFAPAFREQIGPLTPTQMFTGRDLWHEVDVSVTRLICATYLRENGITQGDRLSMANSIEMRLPLVDYKLVETAIGLRKARTDLDLPGKAWLRAATSDILPAWVRSRPKRGFTPPVATWYGSLARAYGHHVGDGFLVAHGVFPPKAAFTLSQEETPSNAVSPLWFKALVLEEWCRSMEGIPSRGHVAAPALVLR